MSYPRDMTGYGAAPPNPHWPGNARLALQLSLIHISEPTRRS